MRKPKSIQISVPHPCSQNWEEMTPQEQGRFCAHCQKTVIDFTTWSDQALYNFFSKNTEGVCGRFHSSQTERPIHIPYQPHSRLYRITIALGLTLIFTQAPRAFAQNMSPKIEQSAASMLPNRRDTLSGEIAGLILNPQRQPLTGVLVNVSQHGIFKGSAHTDSTGCYKVPALEMGYYDIVCTYPRLDTQIITDIVVSQGQRTTVNVTLDSAGIHTVKQRNRRAITGLIEKVEIIRRDDPWGGADNFFIIDKIKHLPR